MATNLKKGDCITLSQYGIDHIKEVFEPFREDVLKLLTEPFVLDRDPEPMMFSDDLKVWIPTHDGMKQLTSAFLELAEPLVDKNEFIKLL